MAIREEDIIRRYFEALSKHDLEAVIAASQESGIYSDTTLSAAAVFSGKIFGVMNWAFLLLRSTSVTPRATEHFPQTKIGTL